MYQNHYYEKQKLHRYPNQLKRHLQMYQKTKSDKKMKIPEEEIKLNVL